MTLNPRLMFVELAKDYFRENGDLRVIGGVISPVADAYGKIGLIEGVHRVQMAKLACADTKGFLQVSSWEVEQTEWTKTLQVLKRIRTFLNENNLEDCKIMLIIGTDVAQTFCHPNIWDPEDVKLDA